MYVITGATGNTGKVIADKLLARGQKVRVIGRDANRLRDLIQKGAAPFVGDVTDASAMTKAFTGVKAVYLLIPPDLAALDVRAYRKQVTDALAAAIEKAGVKHAVLLSSVGADKREGTGPVVGLHEFEERLNGIAGLKALYVRAGYFMENLLPQIGVIKTYGMMAGPVRAGLRLPMIATRDIGAFVAKKLLELNFSGKETCELLGQRDISYDEVAAIVGKAIGKPDLAYSQLPPSQLKPAMTQIGMSANMADLLLEMAGAMNSAYMVPLEPRTPQNTTPTSIETFVTEEFAPRFTEKAAGA